MKRLIKSPQVIEEVESVQETQSGYEDWLGKQVLVFGLVYFYIGRLTGVNQSMIELSDAKICYETGPFQSGKAKFAESPSKYPLRIQVGSFESMCITELT